MTEITEIARKIAAVMHLRARRLSGDWRRFDAMVCRHAMPISSDLRCISASGDRGDPHEYWQSPESLQSPLQK